MASESWHLLLRSKSQVDDLWKVVRQHPGQAAVYLHAEGKMRRIAGGVSSSDQVRRELVRIFGAAGANEQILPGLTG